MAIKLPDLVQHNNPLIPIADSDNVRGGIRSAVASITDLYSISTDLLKQNATRVWVTAASKFYTLTDIANAGNSAGWTADTTGGGSLTYSDGTSSDTITLSTETLNILGSTNITSAVNAATNSATISLKTSLTGNFTLFGDLSVPTGSISLSAGYLYAYGGLAVSGGGLTMQSGSKITLSPLSGSCDITISVPTPNNSTDWEMKLPPTVPSAAYKIPHVSAVASGVASLDWTSDIQVTSATATSGFFATGSTGDVYADRYFVLNSNNKNIIFTPTSGTSLYGIKLNASNVFECTINTGSGLFANSYYLGYDSLYSNVSASLGVSNRGWNGMFLNSTGVLNYNTIKIAPPSSALSASYTVTIPGATCTMTGQSTSTLGSTRIPFSDSSGLLTDSSAFKFTSSIGEMYLNGYTLLEELAAHPTSGPTSSTQCQVYLKGDLFVIRFNDAGTARYKYLALNGTGVTWVHSTTAP